MREVDLQGQLAKAHSSSLHDKTYINKLVLEAEERQLAAEQDNHRQQEEITRLQAVSCCRVEGGGGAWQVRKSSASLSPPAQFRLRRI